MLTNDAAKLRVISGDGGGGAAEAVVENAADGMVTDKPRGGLGAI